MAKMLNTDSLEEKGKVAVWQLLIGLLLFLVCFGIYLRTLYPTVPAYRDCGELITVSYVLGIAHPPGYPLYTLLGKLFTFLPFGNIAYRVNLMSAVFGALTVVLVFLIISRVAGDGATERQSDREKSSGHVTMSPCHYVTAMVAALLLAFSGTFWHLSLVAESYTLDTFFLTLVMLLLLLWRGKATDTRYQISDTSKRLHWFSSFVIRHSSLRSWYLFAFFAGLALTNRTTLILLSPAFFYFIVVSIKDRRRPLDVRRKFTWVFTPYSLLLTVLFFLLGLSVYLYLPLRSFQNPVIDWANPEKLSRLFAVITRKAYGHGLDRISEEYQLSQVLIPQLKIYFTCLYHQFTIVGIILGVVGMVFGIKRKPEVSLFLLFIFLLSGPVFIALAKMPTNPHALAIVEASYAVPNLAFTVFIGLGISGIIGRTQRSAPTISRLLPIMLVLPIVSFALQFKPANHRGYFFAYDYGENVLRTLPANSILLMRKDVQLFTMWYFQWVKLQRPDVKVIAQGLFRSDWYREYLWRKYPQIKLPPFTFVDKDEYLKEFIQINYHKFPVYATGDLEVGKGFWNNFTRSQEGLLVRILPKGEICCPVDVWHKYKYRNVYDTQLYTRFFPPDMISKYAGAHNSAGTEYFQQGLYKEAAEEYAWAVKLKPNFALAWYDLGITHFHLGNYNEAIEDYQKAIGDYEEDLKRKELIPYVKPELAKVHNNLGAVYEKQDEYELAMQQYQKAIELDPSFGEPHYNMGVIYWRQQKWEQVVKEFKETLRLEPGHQNARKYLGLLQERQKR